MEIPTTQKTKLPWTETSERGTNKFNVLLWTKLGHSDYLTNYEP